MAKPLVFQFGDQDLAFAMNKVDRSKLYGYKSVEAIDDHGATCELATLTHDGSTVIPMGGTALGYLSPDGLWMDKTDLRAFDQYNEPMSSVPSSFAAPIKLFDSMSVDEYFQHNIKSVYLLECDSALDDLMAELKKGTIFCFPYSYRGGFDSDVGFLLCNESQQVFLAIGVPTQSRFIGLQQQVLQDDARGEGDDDGDESELMDFDMI